MSKNKISSKGKKSTLHRLFSDMGKNKKIFWTAILIVGAAKICLAFAPAVASQITDLLKSFVDKGAFDMGSIVQLCAVLAFLYFVGYAADGFVNKIMVDISQGIVRKLRIQAGEKLNRLPLKYLDDHPIGDTQSRLTVDMLNLSNGIESTVSGLIAQIVLMIMIVLMMFITDYRLTIIYIVVTPLTFLGLRIIAKATKRLFAENSRDVGRMNSKVSDTFSNHTVVKAFDRVDEQQREFDMINKSFVKSFVRSRFISGFMRPISNIMAKSSYILLCVISGVLMLRGELSLGEFTAFLFYGNMIGTPLSELSVSINNFQNSLSSAGRVYELLDQWEEPEEEPEAVLDQSKVRGEISFEKISFGYVPENQLMKDISFTVKAGDTIAVVGPSGAGKTTLINLLMRFYEINGGTIRLDGTDISKLTKRNLRKMFGMVLQDTWILDGTIAENIAFGKPNATREEIIKAAKTSYCNSFIEKLPNGYDTYISNENSALSAGEKQLICIARAVIADPKILILDEATSQVDTKTEEVITKAMEKMMQGRTSFIIAHRLYTIRNADKIVFMSDGDIKEVGSHDELISAGGYYAKMYNSGTSEK